MKETANEHDIKLNFEEANTDMLNLTKDIPFRSFICYLVQTLSIFSMSDFWAQECT